MTAKTKERGAAALLCLLLAGVTLAVYWPVHRHEFLNYDDGEYVIGNKHLAHGLTRDAVAWAFRSGYACNWHPLTWLSHLEDVELFGMEPGGHHLTSLLFHTANAVLLLLVLRRLTGALWESAFVAALFALHPLHVESVAWVAERKDVLSTFFGLLSLWAYAGWAPRSGTKQPSSAIHRRVCYGLALVFFAFSLMSKPMLVTLPFLMLLLDFWPLQRISFPTLRLSRTPLLRLMFEKAPFLALSAASIVITLQVQEPSRTHLALGARVANAAISYVRYLGKTFWPRNLAIIYPHPMHWPLWQTISSVILLATVSITVLWRARRQPYLAVGWFWFMGMLVPVIGLVQVGLQAMADRYTYLPLVGIFIMIAWAGGEWIAFSRIRAGVGSTVAVAVLAACAGSTWSQLRFWQDSETVFTHALSVTHDNWIAHDNLALLALARYQDTRRSGVESQRLSFGSAPPPGSQASEASAAVPRDYLSEVIFHCQAALQVRPDFPPAHVTLAKALTEQEKLDEATSHLEAAIRLNPLIAEAHQLLAEILHRQGRAKEAVAEYKTALKLLPEWDAVLNNLAWLLATHPNPDIRDGVEAQRLAQQACSLTSQTNLWYLHTLAAAHAEKGDFNQAIATAEVVRRLAAATGETNLIETASHRLELYKKGRPLRDP